MEGHKERSTVRGTYWSRSARMHEHAAHTSIAYCIDFLASHSHHSDEPNAIIFTQVLALSHRAQVFLT